MICVLCGNNNINEIGNFFNRIFFKCSECDLLQVDKSFLLGKEEEKSRYKTHNNFITEPGYVEFLNSLIIPALNFIDKNGTGIDYGCGHTKVLVELLSGKNIKCHSYDPFFFPEISEKNFDFIFASECFEHFHNPTETIEHIVSLIKPGGYLSVMTNFHPEKKELSTWYYLKDHTHVVFYNKKTFEYIAEKYNAKIVFCDNKKITILLFSSAENNS